MNRMKDGTKARKLEKEYDTRVDLHLAVVAIFNFGGRDQFFQSAIQYDMETRNQNFQQVMNMFLYPTIMGGHKNPALDGSGPPSMDVYDHSGSWIGGGKEVLIPVKSLIDLITKVRDILRLIFQIRKGTVLLDKHFLSHKDDFGYENEQEYLNGAKKFLEKPATSSMEGFTTPEGTFFRYDKNTNEFGIINQHGGISTYFKPENGVEYWRDQMELYGK